MKTEEYILCAAIHFRDGKQYLHQPINIETGFVVCGRRHHNCYTTLMVLSEDMTLSDKTALFDERDIQGFITNKDRFVDRKEGWEIALAAEQVKPRVYDNSIDVIFTDPLPKNSKMILISEDLY